ncbi:hypothetical protein L2Y94_02675 [Luteibacter aegosomatis]|uniref:hypothetical protein n=1 Tax=Luteibacter aegosomatis TaxID=2911537 RepID=UPI001FF8BDE8|nr:hypothetical protein [Luteibacter aegosomatis]UPG86289.1 hypothetical protein L2Y94_02675 [Luteibacter aegosomatis]
MNPTMPPMDVPPFDWERQEAAMTSDAAYRVVADVLGEAPDADLPPDFARELERRAYAQRPETRADRLEGALVGTAVALLAIVAIIGFTPFHWAPPAGAAWLVVVVAAAGVSAVGWHVQRRGLPW